MATTKEALASLDQDFSGLFNQRVNAAKTLLSQVNTANLEGPDRMQTPQLQQQIDGTVAQFQQAKAQTHQQLEPEAAAIKSQSRIFLFIFLGLLVIGIILLFVHGAALIGVLLVVVGIIFFIVTNKMTEGKANGLAGQWRNMFTQYENVIGDAETLHAPAFGIYKSVDDLYLKGLDPTARGFEMQQRTTKKQMDAQNEAHQQAMAVQQQQMAALQQMAAQQKHGRR